MKSNFWKIAIFFLMMPLGFIACSDKDEETPEPPVVKPDPENKEEEKEEEPTVSYYTEAKYYANFFAYNVINDVYLWKTEVASSLKNWLVSEDPIKKVNSLRYKEGDAYVDKWTMLTDDYDSFMGTMDGVVTTTYGYDFKLYYKDNTYTTLVAVITFTYPGSPAEKAGLHRGDVIFTVDGKDITVDNYADLLFYSSKGEFAILNDKGDGLDNISMTAVNMYENPVLMSKVFDCGDKKVGYLVYLSFTLDSCEDLIKVAQEFKKQGVTELILDLRYNGGGYVFTEDVLASLLAPQTNVTAKDVFQTEIWNSEYMAYYKLNNIDLNTYFTTKHSLKHNGKEYTFDTANDNIGLSKIYALVSSSSASASESILVGLLPYMNIEIIGEQTHGKYCTGALLGAMDWFQDTSDNYDKLAKQDPTKYKSFVKTFPEYEKWQTYAKNWGIYVMINRYADKNGNCPCMPDGFKPNIVIKDNPEEPYDLGDDREALLRMALTKAGYTNFTPIEKEDPKSRSALPTSRAVSKQLSKNPLDGKRIYIGLPKFERELIRLGD